MYTDSNYKPRMNMNTITHDVSGVIAQLRGPDASKATTSCARSQVRFPVQTEKD